MQEPFEQVSFGAQARRSSLPMRPLSVRQYFTVLLSTQVYCASQVQVTHLLKVALQMASPMQWLLLVHWTHLLMSVLQPGVLPVQVSLEVQEAPTHFRPRVVMAANSEALQQSGQKVVWVLDAFSLKFSQMRPFSG